MNYEFQHPQGEWQPTNAECDAKNFLILSNWPVRVPDLQEGRRQEDRQFLRELRQLGFNLFKPVISGDGVVYECRSQPFWQQTPKLVAVRVGNPGIELELRANFLCPIKCELFRVCPASDPVGMAMPLETRTHKLWFMKLPEEIIGRDYYVRISVPKTPFVEE